MQSGFLNASVRRPCACGERRLAALMSLRRNAVAKHRTSFGEMKRSLPARTALCMVTALHALPPFVNEPIRTFRDTASIQSVQAALETVRASFGRRYPLIINAERIDGVHTTASVNPARPAQIVGDVVDASLEDVSRALDAATARFKIWSKTSFEERSDFLVRAACALRERKDQFNALMILEVGKTWIEADADTAEAIDFLEFYARQALLLAGPPALVASPLPETNSLRYLPLGVGVVLPPWNFALAIMAGMTCAAVVTGNTVVLKPSPDAAVTAAHFVDLLHELGLPPGVVNYVPGHGPSVGEALVTDSRTRFISFTGSKTVGLRINELAAKTAPKQRWIKRVVAEMGGKDAIVVAEDADFDAAVDGVVASAYGFSGQKCSACSRVIVDNAIYDRFVAALVAKTEALKVGDPADPSVAVGPVINQLAVDKIAKYIEIGKQEGRLVTGGRQIELDGGFYFEPTVFSDVASSGRLAQEEIFGPILTVIRAADFRTALEIANDSEFGLTGAVYTGSQEQIDLATDELFVGNLYINRRCTGALVGVHPFGGFNMSGTDSKAGGHDYLLLFVQSQSIAVATR